MPQKDVRQTSGLEEAWILCCTFPNGTERQ